MRRIGEAIGAGLLPPGERLPGQIELAETLGVARMTLRQALAVLEDAGLIEIRRGRTGGAFVAPDPPPPALDPPTAEQLRALTDWRRAVRARPPRWPPGAARPASSPRLRDAAAAVEAAADDAAAYRRADARFHVLDRRARRARTASSRPRPSCRSSSARCSPSRPVRPAPAASRRPATGRSSPRSRMATQDAARAATIRHAEATHDWVRGLARGLRSG